MLREPLMREPRACIVERSVMKKEEYNYFHSGEIKANLCDFALFLSVMRNREAYECLLSIILDKSDFTLIESSVEEVIQNQEGMRAIRLDNPHIIVKDSRLIRLDAILNEVKQSEEWEELKMTIMEYARIRGVEQGISALIEISQEWNRTMEETRDAIKEKLSLSEEEADWYMEKYWK